MKKIFIFICVTLIFNNVKSQKISKEEKKQNKIDFKLLVENISDSEIAYENLPQLDKIEFVKKSSEFLEEIKLINDYNLHRFMPFIDVLKKGKKFYIYKRGLGKTYPNMKNMKEYIQSKEIVNIYHFDKTNNLNDPKCLLFEYKNNIDESTIQYAAIELADYDNRMKFLKKQIQLWEIIEKEEFNISFNTYYETENSCHNYANSRQDFFIVSSTYSADYLINSTYNNFKDNGYQKSYNYKSKPFNMNLNWWYLNFELDSIKYYSLDIISLLNSGILKDNITTYWNKSIETKDLKRYYDLKERITKDNYENGSILDKYESEEIREMSTSQYWEEIIPKIENLEKYLSVDYITLPMSIDAMEYETIDEINSSAFILSMYKFDAHRSDNGFKQGTMTKCNDKYCYDCKVQINYKCALEQNKSKYLYSSVNPENIREELINSLTQIFCEKSGVDNYEKEEKEKEKKYRNDLAEKYGLKYAEAALEGDIIIGMPEDLLTIPLRAWNIDSHSEWENGYLIYCKFKFDTSKRIKIIIRNGKVSEISQW
tara:strand:- start:299 stop:1921 length:1623 start_codon:yes stop_codon:yes gene_type:complete